MSIRTHQATAVVALAAALALTACSDDEEPATDDAATTTEPTAQDRLTQAQGVLTDAGSVSLLMEGTDLPEGQNAYIISADGAGTLEPPAFEGVIIAQLSGVQAEVPTIAVDDALYVELPFTSRYVETDPADLGVPDPAQLFDVETGLVGLLGQTEGAEFGEQTRAGSDVLRQVTGTLPGDAVADLLYVGDREADFDVVYGLVEESWEVRTVTVTGPFYPSVETTYTLTLDDYGDPVEITAP